MQAIQPATPAPMVDEKYGSAEKIMAMPGAEATAIVKDPGASVYARAKACQRLAMVGDRTAVSPLSALLGSEELSAYARTALEQIQGVEADEALREALGKLKGRLLTGVINSIGVRKDRKAIADLARLRYDGDAQVARAADAALARIRPPL